ncbi:Putative oxidoreductase GLYR1 [Gluconacetobacter sp. SXCC-1]|uniref:NAD(P)-dependent oxidoreductase n=1 Tax=Komagataeibacter rhaeticus TaxID=215221 RepID=A0A181C861_9PROT|nr:NAD(P)-dependent oxidoreductase [Komagataeibacter rhaeticus]ATU73499.1 NAD(P)-dependent oxidoreductase [Komagataeibacter xylinus]EGG75901.1 Putative oxidoreductase GLYR1 [Gluconacetobacter sp. SXCC-1]QIP34669.1 NAD(P)-dependent oxidoreductase [Komagataeibacter rhaeticus]QOC47193.1 NAD(P)-dependent oxidoreductase [Komagataeibacter rhaeticus]WPP20468.1 NAD(P)-dependent oxidoreductase [Komagataeibacter rhaeticus]
MSTAPLIGFVGFGAMASRMGANLTKAGYRIAAYTPSGKGGDGSTRFLPTARALAAEADIVLVSVPDDEALAGTLHGPEGVLAGLKAGGVLINTSTIAPETAEALDAEGTARGLYVIDAPVAGSTPEAEAGNLIVLAGGTAEAIARVQKVFDTIGRLTIHAGPAGCGTKLKLVINGIMGSTLAVVAEGVAYGLATGLERGMLFDALDEVPVISPHHKRKLKAAKAGDFSPQFPARLMQKDMRLLLTSAARQTAPLPAMAAATQSLSLTRRRHPDEDYSALFAVMESLVANTP